MKKSEIWIRCQKLDAQLSTSQEDRDRSFVGNTVRGIKKLVLYAMVKRTTAHPLRFPIQTDYYFVFVK